MKSPESVIEVNLEAVRRNLQVLQKKSGTKSVMAVVKVNAYNHGAVRCSRFLEPLVDGFAVATMDEAVELREGGIEKEILVFGAPTEKSAEIYPEYDLSATLSDTAHFDLLRPGTTCHILFDTGMRRMGFHPEQAENVREMTENYPGLRYKGIYSHYATADEPGSGFVHEQNKGFQLLRKQFPDEWQTHMSNSAAVLHYQNLRHFDMIRVGIGLFGYAPGRTQIDELIPALTWKSRISQTRRLNEGDPVSYSSRWRCPSDGLLGTIPVGYADGVPRSLFGKLNVCADGKFYPVVGNITMDACMVFLGKDSIAAGTPVTLMGGEGWWVDKWAEEAGSIPHEIFCGLGRRAEYRYFSEQ
ncbi:MAG: alanine racemase [Balneolaceae bacterium]